jgi:glycerol-3-phosphate dehydrogenase
VGAATNNQVDAKKNSKVTNITKAKDGFVITINNETVIFANNIINAAGHYADVIAKMAGYADFVLTTRRGEYRILAHSEHSKINSVCFMVPTIHGKGVVVAPTLDGRVLVGPTAEEGVPKNETRLVTREMYDYIGKIGLKIIPTLNMDKTEMTLAGSRPIDVATNDFIISYAKKDKAFINAAGMQSPGISSAPAIALEIAKLLKGNGTKLIKKNNFEPKFKIIS